MPEPPPQHDPDHVRTDYADETRLAGRQALWTARTGPQPVDVARERVLGLAPATALEVGCGQGEFAQEMAAAAIDVTAVDQSARMVELTAARGVRAQVADVQALPFADGAFELAVANYMLYHVPDLDRGLSELARVLGPGGHLVAVTNSDAQLREMWDLAGRPRDPEDMPFRSETGEAALAAHFATVERIDLTETFGVTSAAMRAYIRSSRFAHLADRIPELPQGLRVTAAGSVFVARTAR